MNHIGRLFQIEIFGESHGPSVGVVIDGILPGISLTEADFTADLKRRKAGQMGSTTRTEADSVHIESGLYNGKTTGSPMLLRFSNTNVDSGVYESIRFHPRPSHADFVAERKYAGYQDYRGGGHFSGRLSIGLVAAGVIAKKMLPDLCFETKIVNLGGCTKIEDFPLVLEKTMEEQDSIGGIVQIKVSGMPIGLGEPYFDSLESTISHLLFSVGGVKGVEFGTGFDGVSLKGSQFNDCLISSSGKTATNHNGGINGGISNGNDLEIRIFVKPTPSISKAQQTYDFKSHQVEELKIKGRHDQAIVLRAGVVLEACCAIALCDAMLIRKANGGIKNE